MDWWTSLDLARQVFLLVAIIGTTVFAVQLVLQLIGLAGADMQLGDLGSGMAGDHASGMGFLSVRTLTAFAAGFGWSGYAALSSGAPLWLAITIAIVVGTGLMAILVWMMRAMMRLDSNGNLDYANAVGVVGTVYVTIPANQTGIGQVEVQVQGRLCTVQALTRSTTPLAPGLPIRVAGLVERSILLVEPLT